MKRLHLSGTAAFASLIMIAPAVAETRTYPLSDFTRISAAAGVDVVITVGGDYAVAAAGTSRGLERLDVKVVQGELQLRRKEIGVRQELGEDVRISVSMPALEAVDISSGASVDATGVDAGAFAIDVSSGGSLDIKGRCDTLAASVSSGGSIDAKTLVCRSATASASSGGSAGIFASEAITAAASSGGSVDIDGKPKSVTKKASSGGSVDIE